MSKRTRSAGATRNSESCNTKNESVNWYQKSIENFLELAQVTKNFSRDMKDISKILTDYKTSSEDNISYNQEIDFTCDVSGCNLGPGDMRHFITLQEPIASGNFLKVIITYSIGPL